MPKRSRASRVGDEIAYGVVCIIFPALAFLVLLIVAAAAFLLFLTIGFYGSKLLGLGMGFAIFLAAATGLPFAIYVIPQVMRFAVRVTDGIGVEVSSLEHRRWLQRSGVVPETTSFFDNPQQRDPAKGQES